MKTKVLIVFLLFFLVSCTTNSLDEVSSSGSFSSFMMYNLSSNGTLNIMSEDIITRAMVNADNEESDQDNFDIYIDYPEDTSERIKNLTQYVSSAVDIVSLYRHTAATFYNAPLNTESYKITVSKSKARSSLVPALREAKKYLMDQGMTMEEIDAMVTEADGDEIDLISTAIVLVSQEKVNNEQTAQLHKGFFDSLLSLFVTKAYASNNDNMEPTKKTNNDPIDERVIPRKLFETALDCGLRAVGLDIFYGLKFSNAKKWRISVIKRVFKSVSARVLGPVGTAIAAVIFGGCMYDNWDKYTCEYSIPVPLSVYENEFKKVIMEDKDTLDS